MYLFVDVELAHVRSAASCKRSIAQREENEKTKLIQRFINLVF